MSWSKALLLLAVLALGPAGCGFTPVYSRVPGSTANAQARELASVRILGVDNPVGIDDREGVVLRQHLIHALNPAGEPGNPLYYLQIDLKSEIQGQAQSSDGNATIGRMYVRAGYRLIEIQNNKVLFSSNTQAYGSFRLSGPRYGSVAAERAANETATELIAEDIRASLVAWFANHRAAP